MHFENTLILKRLRNNTANLCQLIIKKILYDIISENNIGYRYIFSVSIIAQFLYILKPCLFILKY
jgi:hypothetical protein